MHRQTGLLFLATAGPHAVSGTAPLFGTGAA